MSTFKDLYKEPFLHFLLLGLIIFVVNAIVNRTESNSDSEQIIIDDQDINRLIAQYKQVWNEEPQKSTIQKLMDQYVESEIMYREALAMNLDHNDEIIKRRLKQKYEFLVSDLITSRAPTDSELNAYYEDNKEQFKAESSYSFSQFYFSPDLRIKPLSDAKKFLQDVSAQNAKPVDITVKTDPLHVKTTFENASASKIRSDFGLDFQTQLQGDQSLGWRGPLSSGFGIHVVYVHQINQSTFKDFHEHKDQIRQAFEAAQIRKYNQDLLNQVRSNYSVSYDLDKWNSIVE